MRVNAHGTSTELAPSPAMARAPRKRRDNLELRAAFLIFCFGTLLVAALGLFKIKPATFLPAYMGPEDGLRLRLLWLAGVAACALPLLMILFQGLSARSNPDSAAVRRGRIGMLCGTVGLPTVLAAASLTHVKLKLLLAIPAHALFFGTLCGLWLAKKHARPLEVCGWSLIALSMGVGMLMGLYAFDGPLPPPNFIGAYQSEVRRLIRLGHAYSIVSGLLSIFVSRELERIGGKP